jgi:hypothetical protein
MTTATPLKVAAGKRVPWDFFLNQEGSTLSEDVRVGHLAVLRRHIDAFRSGDWKVILREMKHHLGAELPPEFEPHWIAPGKAIMWHRPMTAGNDDAEWQPSHVVSIGNATNILHQLRKGLRLRPPPEEGEACVEVYDAAHPSDSTGEPPVSYPYACNRHFGRQAAQFVNWRAYRLHCKEMRESLEMEPPQDVLDAVRERPYYCPDCYEGFGSSRAAKIHVNGALRTPRIVAGQHIGYDGIMVRTQPMALVPDVPADQQTERPRRSPRRNKSNRRQ